MDVQIPEIYLPLFSEENKNIENILNWGGRGGGRSYASSDYVVSFCMGKPDDCTFFAGRYYKDDIEGSVYKQIRISMDRLGVKAEEISQKRIKLRGGCEIRFESLKDELNLRSSPKTIGLWYEEAQQADNLITIMNLRATARRVPGIFRFIASMNRVNPMDAMWEFFEKIPDNNKLVTYACVWDNEFASESVMIEWQMAREQLEKGELSQEDYDLVWRGLPNMDGDNSVYRFSALEDARKLYDDTNIVAYIAGLDLAYGGADRCVYTLLGIHNDGHKSIVFTDNWKQITSGDTKSKIQDRLKQDKPIYCGIDAGDGGGHNLYQDLIAEKFINVERFIPGTNLKPISGQPANIRSLATLELAKDILDGKIHGISTGLMNEMNGMLKYRNAGAVISIESKDDMRKRTGKSPDFHDSLMIANYYANKAIKSGKIILGGNGIKFGDFNPRHNVDNRNKSGIQIKTGGTFVKRR